MGKARGVNLGGWLVLEKWITPSVFKGYKAQDEHSLCLEAGANKKDLLKRHRDSFIVLEDFEWIARQGLETVRLPVGYWVFGGEEPFVKADEYLDKAMEWAEQTGLQVIIDLHGAPGSQNGWMHSGKSGEIGWHIKPENIYRTVEVIEEISKRYGKHKCLYGIELLNEPHSSIPQKTLRDFYRTAYVQARKHCYKKVKIIFSDAYRPIAEWEDFMDSSDFENILLDVHFYQLFSDEDKKLTFEEHVAKTFKWKRKLEQFGAEKVIVGEYSGALDKVYSPMPRATARLACKLYIEAQQHAFADTAGWLYWNYKTEKNDQWNYRHVADTSPVV